jgi:hypothetical protein
MKQYKIDNGKIGGLIVIFMNSLFVVSPINFIGILALNYDKYIKYWINIYQFAIISFIFLVIYEWIFFAYIYPSMMTFSNGQVFEAENPVIKRMDIIEEKLDKLLEDKTKNL